MTEQVRPGDNCVITRVIMVEGRVAFKRGERISIEKVEPNSQRPEYKYVVLSEKLGKRFQLGDHDLVKPRIKRTSKKLIIGCLVIVAVIAIFASLQVIYNQKRTNELHNSLTIDVREALKRYDAGLMTEEDLCKEFPGFVRGVDSYGNYEFDFDVARSIGRRSLE